MYGNPYGELCCRPSRVYRRNFSIEEAIFTLILVHAGIELSPGE